MNFGPLYHSLESPLTQAYFQFLFQLVVYCSFHRLNNMKLKLAAMNEGIIFLGIFGLHTSHWQENLTHAGTKFGIKLTYLPIFLFSLIEANPPNLIPAKFSGYTVYIYGTLWNAIIAPVYACVRSNLAQYENCAGDLHVHVGIKRVGHARTICS